MSLSDTAALLLAAMLLDAVIGDPRWLYRIIPHPTVVMGRALSFCDRLFNRAESGSMTRRVAGAVSTLAVVLSFGALGVLVSAALSRGWGGFWLEAFLASVLIAQNSLYRHVADVATALERGGVESGRDAVAHVVGRDPESLDLHGVARSAVESLAENFNDGVVAPVLWGLLFGFPGIVAYKALNTADSMIGHLDSRYRDFGWAAARLDDVANWLPARVAGVLLAASGGQWGVRRVAHALGIMRRDGGAHRSVNAGYPEGAMAGALDLRLAGPRRYKGVVTADPWLGEGTAAATENDIRRGLRVYVGACLLLAVLVGVPWVAGAER
ncbi:MAG: adenosylcobinamide-phosphate synthase CbiB [Deltaproteobacteria bacterium]|nr:adenosylcobinamide-phosphate synthase CbiB [Deltaproteobacteria bacterium]